MPVKSDSCNPKANEAERLQKVYRQYLSNSYNSRWAEGNAGNAVMIEEQRKEQIRLLRAYDRLPNSGTRALDFGCGSGGSLEWLCKLGGVAANFHGVDIRPEPVNLATRRYPHLNFCRAGEGRLPFPDGFFDLIQMHLVLSSILDTHMRTQVCSELNRILRGGAAILIYDFRVNNPGNPNVRGVKRREVLALFPKYQFDFRSLTVVPPLSRRLGGFCSVLYPALKLFPFLRTHNMGLGIKMKSEETA